MTATQGQSMTKYLAVYVCLLAVVALQIFVGYRGVTGPHVAVRFLTFAAIETILVVLFFMNMSSENRSFARFVVIFMLFVIATTNMIWTDSFRLLLYRLSGAGPS
jgi:cytochrome c oxidase subunit IV